nr:hypothetical protein BaRGS_032932 [Batillaria attramentaria]
MYDASQSSHTDEEVAGNEINLLMTSALEQAVVYRNVLSSGLSEVLWLPESDQYDVALCSLAADIEFDGQNEILVGTYGQELLVYKFQPNRDKWLPVEPPGMDLTNAAGETVPSDDRVSQLGHLKDDVTGKHRHRSDEGNQPEESGKHRHKSDESSAAEKALIQRKVKSEEDLSFLAEVKPDPSKVALAERSAVAMELRTVQEPHYELLWQRSFACPVMRLDCADMMGDGVENLIVLTLLGLHIMQPDLGEVSSLLISRLQQLCMSESDIGDEFHKLQTEIE